jgi:glucoamylase
MKAPEARGTRAVWSPAAKEMVGGSLGPSRLWFTLSQGIISEVYSPRVDIPGVKDLGFIVADDRGFWVELKGAKNVQVEAAGEGIPAVTIRHTHDRFLFTCRVVAAPARDVLLVEYRLVSADPLRVYPLLSARLGGEAFGNVARVLSWHGRQFLTASQGPFSLSLGGMGSGGKELFTRLSCGETEESDGWQDFARHGRMVWSWDSAGPGQVALTGEGGPSGTLALAFAASPEAASTLSLSALAEGFESQWEEQVALWKEWQESLHLPPRMTALQRKVYRTSAMVLKVHEDKTFPGALIASLSIPWGEASDSRGGYHLVWSRDLSESAGAALAMGDRDLGRRILAYLLATQQEDGHWLQNQWLGGKPYWQGLQLDEAAFPVLLAAWLAREGSLDLEGVRPMIVRALSFIIREGPVTGQDRWEEDPGINLFTLAVAISALVDGSALLDAEEREAALWVADTWNASLERWCWSGETDLARRIGVSGYYLRAVPEAILEDLAAKGLHLLIKNRCHDPGLPACDQISTDFFQLVRFGLRSPEDPFIRESRKAVDRLLRAETPAGTAWYRYNGDGYGEHEDGAPFDGTGRGRPWPLLAGERGHVAVVAGESARGYLRDMATMASPLGLLPEQVWDAPPLPERGLYPGAPTGSAMPLVWAHAEFIKLAHSEWKKKPVDRPEATWTRYGGVRPEVGWRLWRHRHKVRTLEEGRELRFLWSRRAMVHWGVDGWKDPRNTESSPLGMGFWGVALPVRELSRGQAIVFTFYWIDEDRWEGEDYRVEVVGNEEN